MPKISTKKQNTIQSTFQFKIAFLNGKKVLELLSRDYYQHFLNTQCKIGEIGSMFLTFKKPTRSENQLRYYWTILGLMANELGYKSEELHEWIMIMCFGTKKVTVNGITKEVRKSISDKARMSISDCITLIDFTLEKCAELNIVVPNKESLGYISN